MPYSRKRVALQVQWQLFSKVSPPLCFKLEPRPRLCHPCSHRMSFKRSSSPSSSQRVALACFGVQQGVCTTDTRFSRVFLLHAQALATDGSLAASDTCRDACHTLAALPAVITPHQLRLQLSTLMVLLTARTAARASIDMAVAILTDSMASLGMPKLEALAFASMVCSMCSTSRLSLSLSRPIPTSLASPVQLLTRMCALDYSDDSTLQPAMTALVQAWSQYPMCCPVTGDALIRLTVHWIATAPFHPDHTSAKPKRTAIAVDFFDSIRRFRTANTAVDATDIDPHAAVAITTLFTKVLDAEALPAPTPSLCFVVDALPPSVLGFSCGFLRRVVRQLTDAQAAICLGRILQWPLTNSIGTWHVCVCARERERCGCLTRSDWLHNTRSLGHGRRVGHVWRPQVQSSGAGLSFQSSIWYSLSGLAECVWVFVSVADLVVHVSGLLMRTL